MQNPEVVEPIRPDASGEGLSIGFTHYVPVGGEPSRSGSRARFESGSTQGRGYPCDDGVVYRQLWKAEQIAMSYDTGSDQQTL